MPVKVNPTKDVKCKCGKNTTVSIEPATAYCKLTRFVCKCGEIYHIVDYMNGCIVYYCPSCDVDAEVVKMLNKERKRCSYPMSDFYIYEDEVIAGERVSTIEDCKGCDIFENDCCDDKHCLIIESKEQKDCFNHCPACDAGEDKIDWGQKDWADNCAWQSATCEVCGCEFEEFYHYANTEYDITTHKFQTSKK